MNQEEMTKYKFWLDDNGQIWMVDSYCLYPSCSLKHLGTGLVQHFGLGGLIAEKYKPIKLDLGIEATLVELIQIYFDTKESGEK